MGSGSTVLTLHALPPVGGLVPPVSLPAGGGDGDAGEVPDELHPAVAGVVGVGVDQDRGGAVPGARQGGVAGGGRGQAGGPWKGGGGVGSIRE